MSKTNKIEDSQLGGDQRRQLAEKYRRLRIQSTWIWGVVAGVAVAYCLIFVPELSSVTEPSSRTTDKPSPDLVGGTLMAGLAMINGFYSWFWRYSPRRDPFEIQRRLKVERERQDRNGRILLRLYGWAIVAGLIILTAFLYEIPYLSTVAIFLFLLLAAWESLKTIS